jgi:hypothetical protein
MSNTNPPKLLDQVRNAMQLRHYSLRTEESYVQWIKRYILFHGKKHPKDMAEPEVTVYLTHLAVDGKVSASTQNQALSAIQFVNRGAESQICRDGMTGARTKCHRSPGVRPRPMLLT